MKGRGSDRERWVRKERGRDRDNLRKERMDRWVEERGMDRSKGRKNG